MVLPSKIIGMDAYNFAYYLKTCKHTDSQQYRYIFVRVCTNIIISMVPFSPHDVLYRDISWLPEQSNIFIDMWQYNYRDTCSCI